jgi:hypothetical protein
MGPVPGHWDRGGVDRGGLGGPRHGSAGHGVREDPVPAEAGVALAALRVEDPERRPPPRRTRPIATDGHLSPLADDVSAKPDPARSSELQADAGRLAGGAGKGGGEIRWLEDDERDPGTACERAEAPEPVRDLRRGRDARREVDHEEIDRPAGQQ